MPGSFVRRSPISFLLGVALLVLAHAQAAHADAKIGVASAVKNQVLGRAGALSVGSSVFANERIRTGEASTAQLMFLDKTVLSMGPKAELLLDKYVYNPNRGSGQVVVNAVQGSMRFVTGAQNPTNYSVKTPVATLGIRGTIVDIGISAFETFIGVLEGTLVIRLLNGTEMTLPAGWYVRIAANGSLIGNPQPYKGDDPIDLGFAAFDRRDDIDQINAKDASQWVKPKPKPSCSYYCLE
jgi:ferric-dicitrate binding protein FerR (iron transport regulator)